MGRSTAVVGGGQEYQIKINYQYHWCYADMRLIMPMAYRLALHPRAPLLLSLSAAFATDTRNRRQQQPKNQQSKRQAPSNIRDLLRQVSQNRNIDERDLGEACRQLVSQSNTLSPWDNVKFLGEKLRQLDPAKMQVETLANVSATIPILMQYEGYRSEYSHKVCEQIEVVCRDTTRLRIQELIKFYQCCHEMKKYKLCEMLCLTVEKRLDELDPRDYRKLLHLVCRLKTPSAAEKNLVYKFMHRMNGEINQLPMEFIIRMYGGFKVLNSRLFSKAQQLIKNIEKVIEQRIAQKLPQMEEKAIQSLLTYKSPLNAFASQIYSLTLNSIQQDGTSSLDAVSIFKRLQRIFEARKYIIMPKSENEEKFMRFLEKNIEHTNFIIGIIRKEALAHSQVARINSYVIGNNLEAYLRDYDFMYELAIRRLIQPVNYKYLLEKARADFTQGRLTEKFVTAAVLTSRLRIEFSDKPQFQQLQTYFEDLVGDLNNMSALPNPFFIGNPSLMQAFNNRYGHLFVPNFIEKLKRDQKPVLSSNTINYFFYARDWKNMKRMIRESNASMNISGVRILLYKVRQYPNYFPNLFEFLHMLLIEYDIDYIHKQVANYLCSYDIHMSLSEAELTSFLWLTRKVAKKLSFYTDFISYFTHSPRKQFKCLPEYVNLLYDLAIRDIEKSTKDAGSSFSIVGFELTKYNRFNARLARHCTSVLQQSDFVYQYAKVVLNEPIDPEVVKISPESLMLFTRSRVLPEQFLQDNFELFKATIERSSKNVIEQSLLNFELPKTEASVRLLGLLLNAYSAIIQENSYRDLKILLVLHEIQRMNARTPEQVQFVETVYKYLCRNTYEIIDQQYPLLLNAVHRRGISADILIDKLRKSYEIRASRSEIPTPFILQVLPYLLMHNADQANKLFVYTLKRLTKASQIEYLLGYLYLANLENDSYVLPLLQFFNSKRDLQIEEGIHHFLVTKRKQFADIKVNSYKNERPSPLCESMMSILDGQKIEYSLIESKGHFMLKIGSHLITFFNQRYNYLLQPKLKQFSAVLFNIPIDQYPHITVVFEQNMNRETVTALSESVPELRNHFVQLAQVVQQVSRKAKKTRLERKYQNRNQEGQGKSGSLEEALEMPVLDSGKLESRDDAAESEWF